MIEGNGRKTYELVDFERVKVPGGGWNETLAKLIIFSTNRNKFFKEDFRN